MTSRVRHLFTVAVAAALLAATACTGDDSPAPDSAAPGSQPPLTAGAPDESELGAGWDEQPDGPPPTPDAGLSDAEVADLLRTRASAADGAEMCGPTDVTAKLSGFDLALGHRYTSLVVTNTSSRSCVVDGVAGLGARGEWGNRFTLTVEPGLTVSGKRGRPVRLAPGAEARSLLEWTGELAGHGAERASLFAVQLAAGQVPLRVSATLDGMPAGEDDLDAGMLTTVRLGPFEPLD